MAAPDCLAAQCFCRKSEAINSERCEHLADIIQRARSMIENCIASRTIEIRVDRHNARQRMDRTSPIFPTPAASAVGAVVPILRQLKPKKMQMKTAVPVATET